MAFGTYCRRNVHWVRCIGCWASELEVTRVLVENPRIDVEVRRDSWVGQVSLTAH